MDHSPQTLRRCPAMLGQGNRLAALPVLLLHLGEFRLQFLQSLHQTGQVVFVAGLAAPRPRAFDALYKAGTFQLGDMKCDG